MSRLRDLFSRGADADRPEVRVVGAALLQPGAVLAAKRGPGMDRSGRWELPGGKVEDGEEPTEALRRELREELGVEAEIGEWLGRGIEDRADRRIALDIFAARVASGEPRPLEHEELRWVGAEELGALDWMPSDRPVLSAVAQRIALGSPLSLWVPYRELSGYDLPAPVEVRRFLRSAQLENRRDLFVALPPTYEQRPDRRYPVLYFQDGQNVFDPALSFAGAWHAIEALQATGREAILVGVPNQGRSRFYEYAPFIGPPFVRSGADLYLDFLVEKVVPTVEHRFRTRTSPGDRGILGSSLGGLFSLYAAFRRPDVFGLCGALSPSLQVAHHRFFHFVRRAEGRPERVYLDVGTREVSRPRRRFNSRHYSANATAMRELLRKRGFRLDRDLRFVRDVGAGHHESAWARRLPGALDFLLGGRRRRARE